MAQKKPGSATTASNPLLRAVALDKAAEFHRLAGNAVAGLYGLARLCEEQSSDSEAPGAGRRSREAGACVQSMFEFGSEGHQLLELLEGDFSRPHGGQPVELPFGSFSSSFHQGVFYLAEQTVVELTRLTGRAPGKKVWDLVAQTEFERLSMFLAWLRDSTNQGKDFLRLQAQLDAEYDRVREMIVADEIGVAEPEGVGDPPDESRARRGKASVNARMLEMLQREANRVAGWTARQWAGELDCSVSTVADTDTWQNLMKTRHGMGVERSGDRARGRTGGRFRKRH